MSSITNEPILLNSTGEVMATMLSQQVERLDRQVLMQQELTMATGEGMGKQNELLAAQNELLAAQNAHLAVLASEARQRVCSDFSQIAHIIRTNSVEVNQKIFPVGSQFVVPWKDMDDDAHNTDATAYQVPLDVVHHAEVTLTNGDVVPGMYLQWHYAAPFALPYGYPLAFYKCYSALKAGSYYIQPSSGVYYNFTLTQAVPSGGSLVMETGGNELTSNWKVSSYQKYGQEKIETVAVTYGISAGTGTKLSLNNNFSTSELFYGSTSHLSLNDYLNASGSGWWSNSNLNLAKPSCADRHGFLTGFDDAFLSAISTRMPTYGVITSGSASSKVTSNRSGYFFLPSLSQLFMQPVNSSDTENEGPVFEYWRQRSSSASATRSLGTDIFALGDETGTSVQCWLRSIPYTDADACKYQAYLSSKTACNVLKEAYFMPVCVVC